MSADYLSNLPVDLFIRHITYLPFDDVISVCKANKTLHNYCIDSKYNNKWRSLIDATFGNIYDYQNKLKAIWAKLNLGEGVYNYLVYSHLVKLLDPVTQLMIYYRQGDTNSFDNPHYTKVQRFLSLFLLDNVKEMMNYLPNVHYLPFISMLEGHKIDQNILDKMLTEMAKEGSVQGISIMLSKGANIRAGDDLALIWSIRNRHLEVIKYLVERGANIHAYNDKALTTFSQNGHLEMVKYLVEHGANIHTQNDAALRYTSGNGHLEVVKYLVEHDANVRAQDNGALRWASENGHLEVVKYLIEHGANVHADDDWALKVASERGHLDVVKYFVEHGANIHADDDEALREASLNGHLEIVKYLVEQGADVLAQGEAAMRLASQEGHIDIVEFLWPKIKMLLGV